MALHRRQVTYSSRPSHAARRAHAQGDQMFRTYDTSYITGKRQKQHRGHIVFGVVLAIVVALILFFAISSCASKLGAGELVPEGTNVTITVSEGESTSSIAQSLADARLVSRASDFSDAAQQAGASSSLKPGTYTIAGGTSAQDIVSLMVSGPDTSNFTVPEGLKASAVAQIVSDAYGGKVTVDDFMAYVGNASSYEGDYPFVAGAYNNSLEGFLFPKTYDILDGATADAVVRQMLSQYQTETSGLNLTSQGLTSYQALVLASIVEKESDDSTRAKVASVFYNRLNADMRLQSDATVAYVVGHDPSSEEISSTDSPYNTYNFAGLPAGPICSPGLDALNAVCNPESTKYYYFYFQQNDQGGLDYFFSETFDEHRTAVSGEGSATGTSSGN
ncbi:endolytic transglycosylase MltG [Curtanaerobium respiraculi]|uniref:endolytic transglycosylase MltG n=1 Tax=Curtanaerobium respiraculi TaxID=2949669 RepID=UPI0024B34B7B|nr:endolytic transglycosylase MltG [Curtanaerobium respiraculi]